MSLFQSASFPEPKAKTGTGTADGGAAVAETGQFGRLLRALRNERMWKRSGPLERKKDSFSEEDVGFVGFDGFWFVSFTGCFDFGFGSLVDFQCKNATVPFRVLHCHTNQFHNQRQLQNCQQKAIIVKEVSFYKDNH